MAAGVPVVLPAHGAYVELVEATGGGVLVEPHRPEAFTDAVVELLEDPARAAALGRKGHEAVFGTFGVVRAADETERLFAALADHARPADERSAATPTSASAPASAARTPSRTPDEP
jgi:starch synthase